MFNKGEQPDNAEQLNNLLKDAFLDQDFDDPKNEAMLEALSTSVMLPGTLQKSKKSFKEVIGRISLQSVLLICSGTIALILGLGFWLKKDVQKKETAITNPQRIIITKPQSKVNEKKTTTIEVEGNSTPGIKEEESATFVQKQVTGIKQQTQTPFLPPQSKPLDVIPADTSTVNVVTEKMQAKQQEPVTATSEQAIVKPKEEMAYGFPQFTEQDVKTNMKQKKKMIDQLLKPAKPNYLMIPKGTLVFKGNKKTVGDFYMQGHEVTNLEYRTFLFDLMMEKRKEEYIKAKPNGALWLNCIGNATFDDFKNEYFSNKAFNDYPVVNITAEAAKMYCVWLDTILKAREDERLEFYVDLPKESEWIYAAKGGHEAGSYPWGKDEIQNPLNCFLANFNVQEQKEKFRQPYGYKNITSATAFTSAGLATNKDTVATVSVFEYNPNAYGLYCMSGNVAEWVLSEDGQSTKAMGGSWGSDFEHLKINSENEFKGKTCSPFIGFRLLVSIRQK